jgi:hypothetical protein
MPAYPRRTRHRHFLHRNPRLRFDDTRYPRDIPAGDVRCLCSRCNRPIPPTEIVIRLYPPEAPLEEFRYHHACYHTPPAPEAAPSPTPQ